MTVCVCRDIERECVCMYRVINRDRVCVEKYKVCVCRVKERWREKECV